jgi:lipopolysaccharide biosynthesis regulator YciM
MFTESYSFGKDIQRMFTFLKSFKEEVMATFGQLQAQVDALEAAINNEQAQIQEIIDALNALIADGGTVAERQALLDKLVAMQTDLEGTVTPTEPET